MTVTQILADINPETLRQLPRAAGAYILMIELSANLAVLSRGREAWPHVSNVISE